MMVWTNNCQFSEVVGVQKGLLLTVLYCDKCIHNSWLRAQLNHTGIAHDNLWLRLRFFFLNAHYKSIIYLELLLLLLWCKWTWNETIWRTWAYMYFTQLYPVHRASYCPHLFCCLLVQSGTYSRYPHHAYGPYHST